MSRDEKNLVSNPNELVRIAAAEGARVAYEIIEEERRRQREERRDLRLRNTKLLLRNYRDLKEHAKKAIYSVEQAESAHVDIQAMMEDMFYNPDMFVDSIKRRKAAYHQMGGFSHEVKTVKKGIKCSRCVWKTTPGDGIVVCTFPQCVYPGDDVESPICNKSGDFRHGKKEENNERSSDTGRIRSPDDRRDSGVHKKSK